MAVINIKVRAFKCRTAGQNYLPLGVSATGHSMKLFRSFTQVQEQLMTLRPSHAFFLVLTSQFCLNAHLTVLISKFVTKAGTALRVLGLRMEGTASSWRLAANILNKQPRTNDKGWSSSLGVGRGANNPSP
jgi:hypothetical protein